jgi:hypothetical protein
MYNRVYEDDDLAPKVRSRGPKVWTTARTGRRDKAQAIEATRELRKPGWTPSSPARINGAVKPTAICAAGGVAVGRGRRE